MSWLTSFQKPKLKKNIKNGSAVPDHLWQKDPKTGTMVHRDELEKNYYVFPSGAHMRIGPIQRFEQLFDRGQYELLPHPKVKLDPLGFVDLKKYTDRLEIAKKGENPLMPPVKMNGHADDKEISSAYKSPDALVAALGQIAGKKTIIACFDFYFMAGTMGLAVGQVFCNAAMRAIQEKAAFIAITASGGARMQEGVFSLMQLPRTIIAIKRLKSAKLPYLVILADPTTGGVTASLAMLGDIHIAEPNALIGFAGRRVIEQTTRSVLPKDFQTAEFLQNHGVIDMVVERKDLAPTLGKLLNFLM